MENDYWVYTSDEDIDTLVNQVLVEAPRCKTCNELLQFEGTTQRNGHVYADFNCGFGGHNTTEYFIK